MEGTIVYGVDGPGSVAIYAPPARMTVAAEAPAPTAACLLCQAPIPVAGPAFVAHVKACADAHPQRYAELVRRLEAGEVE